MRRLQRSILLTFFFIGSFAFLRAPSAAGAGTDGAPSHALTLQQAFHAASREFGVPEPLLLAVSYNESLWEQHGGAPSTSGGYGLMHLTHVDQLPELYARGDGVLRRSRPVQHDPALHTLDAAAGLLRLRPAVLARDPAQNIRGGAALLAEYARQTTGTLPARIADWYGAVAVYSGSTDAAVALDFADTVYATIRRGETRTTEDGQRLRLMPEQVSTRRDTIRPLHLHADAATRAECPPQVACSFIPAAYKVINPRDPTDYGNYDAANRPKDGLAIRYIVIHDTESSYASAVSTFQDPTSFASANYVVRAADGHITQMVRTKNVAWHAGNYYVNMHSIGIEHEGVAIEGAKWYSEQLYQTSARLVGYLAHRYHIPLDRAHILGHAELPGLTPKQQSGQHWDPGPYWNWQHYMELLGAQDSGVPGIVSADPNGQIVIISPDFATNQPNVTYCYSAGDCRPVAPQPSNFVYLRTAPSQDAPLLGDPALHPAGEAGTTRAGDWGDRAVAGQQFYRVTRQGQWDAIDYAGRKAWFYNPDQSLTTAAGTPGVTGTLVTPKAGRASIPVYGCAYPEASAYPSYVRPRPKILPLQYTIPAGQTYVATDLVKSDYYWTPTMKKRAVITGHTRYYEIFFNDRHAFVKASDVAVQTVQPS